ncbi:MAG: hypothetical protein ABSF96_04725 [Steroidobacteraceae bacterium]|jgi:hypothetical protein
MRSAAATAIAGSEFDQFLYASIAEERSGMLLSVLSALARMNLDPWDEAARLARLPRATATNYLTTLIAALPDGPTARADPGALAERLIALLPRRVAGKDPSPAARPVPGGFPLNRRPLIGPLVVYLALMLLLLANQWLTERTSQAAARARPAASAQTSGTLPQTPAPSSATPSAPPRS